MGALLRHEARKESLAAAVPGSQPSAAPSAPPPIRSGPAGAPPPVAAARASAATSALPTVKHIDLVKQPDATIQSLSAAQLGSLAQALNLGPADAPALHDPAARAQLLQDVREHLDMKLEVVFEEEYDTLNENEGIKRSILMKGTTQEQKAWKESDKLNGTNKVNDMKEMREKLQRLAEHTHLWLRENTITDPETQSVRTEVDIYFDGLPDKKERQNGTTLKGGVGQVYRCAKEAGGIVAAALENREDIRVRRVCGLSLGGGSAQMFAAGLQGACKLSHPPSLVLADPALFNRAQVKHAKSPHYDLRSSHGVIITLNAAHAPRRNLVDNLESLGLRGTGLVRISLGLKQDDGREGARIKPYNAFFGYHGNVYHYGKALNRFLGAAMEPAAAAQPGSASAVSRVGESSR
ncbi:polycystic kidney disease 1-like 3 [Xanthomonas hyacinthi]|uniref:Polycystic kidney disease 1-like 3 n=1 Tax=Xanthomonas hyacinthi TaxID=56455 RepID=A0A2S7EWT5_9XANT|nr:polycystic kidney disease 1-like 3 [Xanthomonas hyacinthi DSM 19077]PPU97556.1 polycystic kidney disease 1-like 3 [Xanthomonas hyacinthi]QGY77279.1 polycystic kidney disease 1-like 3 [Xanthomonas hyacinthi]